MVFPIRIPLPRPLTRLLVKTARKARILNSPLSHGSTSHGSPKPTPVPPATNTELDRTTTTLSTPHSPPPERDSDDLLDKKYYLSINLSTAPVIGVFLLLASTSIPGDVVRTGIVGSGGVKPYDIMTLFISLVSISMMHACFGYNISGRGADIWDDTGLHLLVPGLHRPATIHGLLGRPERRYIREKTIPFLLPVLLLLRCHRRERESA